MPVKVFLSDGEWGNKFLSCQIVTPSSNDAQQIEPERPVVVWIHPVLISSCFFAPQMEGEMRKYNNILVDLLGHGDSSQHLPYSPSFSEAFHCIYTQLGFKQAHFVVVGAMVRPVTSFILKNPAMALSLTIGSLYLKEPNCDEFNSGLTEVISIFREAANTKALDATPTLRELEARNALLEFHYGTDYYKNDTVGLIGYVARKGRENTAHTIGFDNFYLSSRDFLMVENRLPLDLVPCPVLVIRGEVEAQTPAGLMDEYITEINNRCTNGRSVKLITIAGGPHLCSVTHPAEFTSAVLSNLSTSFPSPTFPSDYVPLSHPWTLEMEKAREGGFKFLVSQLIAKRKKKASLTSSDEGEIENIVIQDEVVEVEKNASDIVVVVEVEQLQL